MAAEELSRNIHSAQKQAELKPVFITSHGALSHVMISIKEYQAMYLASLQTPA